MAEAEQSPHEGERGETATVADLIREVREILAQAQTMGLRERAHESQLPPVLTVEQAAKLLMVTEQTIYAAISRRELPGVRRIGRTIRIHRDSLLDWLRSGRAK